MNSTDEFLNELYEDYYLQCEAFCKEFDQNNDAFSYLYEDKFYKEYYSNFDFSDGNRDKIIYEYLKEITKVVKYLGNDKFSDDEKLLNYLEYFRIYVMYLPYKDTTDFPYLTHESRFNAALLGQGTCVGQSRFLIDLLRLSNFKKYGNFEFCKTNVGHVHSFITGTDLNTGENIRIDPVIYRGTGISIEQCLVNENNRFLSDFFIDQSQIFVSRQRALNFIINECNILKDKDFDIIGFSEELISKCNFDEGFNSGCITFDNKKVDIGKIFEIYCFLYGIKYNYICSEDRRNTIYSIYIKDKLYQYNFRSMYIDENMSRKYCKISKNSIK